MSAQGDYRVELEVFEGPLDLLLYLIRRDEVDIYNIPIERVTTQYMEYLGMMRMLDLNIAGEFIVMAATLMVIKSRMLLPVEERPELEDEEDDPRWELVKQLLEYKKFKDAALQLQQRESLQENVFGLGCRGLMLEPDDPGLLMQDVSLFDLLAAFKDVLKRAKPDEVKEIFGESFTVAEKIDHIVQTIRQAGRVRFRSLFGEAATRHEIVCTFLALLELIRLRHVLVRQQEHFGEIEIVNTDESHSLFAGDAAVGEEPEPPADPEPETPSEDDAITSGETNSVNGNHA